MKPILIAGALALLGAMVAPTVARADYPYFVWDDRQQLTFSGPVALPGVTLPAGTYWFRFPNRNGARTVIQVLSYDRKTVYALLMTTQAWRTAVSHQPEVVFGEARADAPPPIEIWYPAHERMGYEFIYPKKTAPTGLAMK